MYHEKDVARGVEGTFMWLMEEVGELATALRNGSHEERVGEFADVLAWLTTIANVVGVDLTQAVLQKYGADAPVAAVSSALALTRGNHDTNHPSDRPFLPSCWPPCSFPPPQAQEDETAAIRRRPRRFRRSL